MRCYLTRSFKEKLFLDVRKSFDEIIEHLTVCKDCQDKTPCSNAGMLFQNNQVLKTRIQPFMEELDVKV